MLTQIGQKKKKEALRRLSHGSTSSNSLARGTFRTSHVAEQWPPETKYSDKHKMQRRPGPISHRPIKRRHVSPLDRGHYKGTVDQQDMSNIPGMDFVGFGAMRSSDSPSISQLTMSTTKNTSMASTFSVSTAGVFQPVSSLQQSRGVVSNTTSKALVTTFAMVGPSSSTTVLNSLPGLSSGSIASHHLNPVFGTSFNAKSESTCTEPMNTNATLKVCDVYVPASSSSVLSIGGFGKVTTSSGVVFSTTPFNTGAVSDTGGSTVSFKQCETFPSFVGSEKESKSTPLGSLSSNPSSVAKPLPIMMPASSYFTAAGTDRPSAETWATLGKAVPAAAVESKAKVDSEVKVLFQEKTKGITTALLTSLVLKDIPENCNKNAWLKRFYSKFGEVTKVVCNPSKKSATVTFKTHEAADAAKKKGKIFRPGLPPVAIFWKRGNRRSTSERDQQPLHSLESCTVPKAQTATAEQGKKTAGGSTFQQKTSNRSKTSEMLGDIEEYIQSLQACQNAGEKQQVLEEVDKKLRQVVKKASDISTAEAVVGTCKDMCPEKERYTREYQRRLSVFESIPGTGSMDENPQVDHSRAVKEYDRSAADKEEPLPHELRPVPVLRMTMDYLATNIMGAGEGREGEWFDFLWNRTRGIRKDITQQHLCDPDCVDLVEKTARFHIFCAHFLCETDMSSFDAKINTENLTKCLQTLKQFYGDLYKDKGITCPMEAEFRAYDILLNLNEGNILREVMTFRDEIQRSSAVKFAMAIFHALNSNNFVRFFRLLGNASYLNACLLHRYFNQVRSKAVQTLNHSLSISNRTTSFPLKDLVETLAFENESEAGDFCTFHGLPISEGCVVFSRSSFIEPETRFAVKRAWGLIESKRNVSVGEVVYSGPLPPPPQHLPSLSFSDDGSYVANIHSLLSVIIKEEISSSQPVENHQSLASIVAEEVKHGGRPSTEVSTRRAETSRTSHKQVSIPSSVSLCVTPNPAQQPFTQLPEAPPKATQVYAGEEIITFTKNLFLEVINEMFADITKEAFDKVHSLLRLSGNLADNILKETFSEVVKETAESLLQVETYKKRNAEEKAASHERVSLFVQGDVTKELVSRECARIVQEVVREVQEELLERARAKACQDICQHLIEEGARMELRELISEVINEEKAERDARLHQLALRVIKARTAQYFNRWLKAYQTSEHVKGLLSTFPPGAPMLSPDEQLRHLVGHTGADIKVAVIRTEAEQAKIHKTLKQRQSDVEWIRRQVCKPLDIPSLLVDELRLQPVACVPVSEFAVYWKLVISFPESCRDELLHGNTNNAVETSFVIREKFKRGPYPLQTHIPQALQNKVDLLSLYRAEVRTFPNQRKLLGICVKACYGELTNTQQRQATETYQFHGASAVMFVVDGQELQFSSQAASMARVRLRCLVESKPPVPALPVAIVLIDDNSADLPEDIVFSLCGIQDLVTKGFVSDCKVWRISSLDHTQDSLTRTVASIVSWFGRYLPTFSVPRMDSLENFIEDGVQREFTIPVSEDLYLRKKAKLEPQCPEAIIELFNGVLEHLGAVASSSTLHQLSWPISEFSHHDMRHHEGLPVASWNSAETRRRLQELILSLKLPPPPPPAVDGAWKSESGLCLNYARCLARDTTSLTNRVKWILDRAEQSLQDVNFLSVSSRLSASQVPWPLVLEACVYFKLTPLHVDPGLAKWDVYYSLEELEKFVPPTLWRRSVNLSKAEAAEANNKCRLKVVTPKNRKQSKIQESFLEVESWLEEKLSESPSPETIKTSHVTLSAAAVTPCSNSFLDSSIQVASEQLKSALEVAKTESVRFEELLKNVLSDGNTLWNFRNSAWRKRKARSMGESKKSPRFLEGFDVPTMNTSLSSLEDRLSCLNESIKSQRRSDQFTDRRLMELLET